jgi:hypothetical protein
MPSSAARQAEEEESIEEEIATEQSETSVQSDSSDRETQQTEEEIAAVQFKPQAMKFLKALREDNVEDFSQLVLDGSFYISRIFTFGNYEDARGEEVLSQKIDLEDIASLNFPIGAKNQFSELNRRFYSVFDDELAYEAPFERIPTKTKSTDVFFSVEKSRTEFMEQCESLIAEFDSEFAGFVIIRVGEDGFVLARFQGSALSYSEWAYFENVGDSFYLKSVFLFY